MGRAASFILCLAPFAASALASRASAHEVSQSVGAYQDNAGKQRQRLLLDGTVERGEGPAGMTAATFDIAAQRDLYENNRYGDDDNQYQQEIYGQSRQTTDTVTLTASQTWDKLTDTRVMAQYASDDRVKNRTWSAGASQWLAHETVRVGVDLSRTIVEQPLYEVLDYDSEQIGNPTVANSAGVTLTVRHLASPTTILDYTASHIDIENRPAQNNGTIAIRRFVPALDGAVHASVTRADNRGYVTTESNYGQVDAWIAETSYLQNLWKGGRGRVGYRYYQEDEITRAFGDHKQIGSDTVTVALAQDLTKKNVENLGVPITLDAAASRYANNDGVAAQSLELGVTAKF